MILKSNASSNCKHVKMSNNNNNNNNTSRNNTSKTNQNSHSHPNHHTRCQTASRNNPTKKNNKNATFTPPEWAHKDLGNHVFVTRPNAPTKHHKTKLAIINCITKEMTHAEAIKWALKHEEEHNFDLEGPKTKDENGDSKKMDTTTANRCQLKSETELHLEKKEIHKSNKTTACRHIIGQCTQSMKNELEARDNWKIIEDNMMATLKAIKEISCNHQTTKCNIGTVSKVIRIALPSSKKTINQQCNMPSATEHAKTHWRTDLEGWKWKKPQKQHRDTSSFVTRIAI